MTAIDRTAYPRFTRLPSDHELVELFTPSEAEMLFAQQITRSPSHQLHILVLLKVFQRLGYVPPQTAIPPIILEHIAATSQLPASTSIAEIHERTRRYHAHIIRDYLGIQRADQRVRSLIETTLRVAATTMDNPADLINAAIEEVIRHRCELPAYSTFDTLAQRVRQEVNASIFAQVARALKADHRSLLDLYLQSDSTTRQSTFARLKEPPPSASFKHLSLWLDRIQWLDALGDTTALLAHILPAKILHFAAEAKSLDTDDLRDHRMGEEKRVTLLLCLQHHVQRRTRDQVIEMFLKRIARMHRSGRDALTRLRESHQATTARLLHLLSDVITATDTTADNAQLGETVRTIVADEGGSGTLRDACTAISAYHSHNYYPLMGKYYARYRPLFFRLIKALHLCATTSDHGTMDAVEWLIANEYRRSLLVPATIDLAFTNDLWQRTIIQRKQAKNWHRRQPLEMAIFSMLAQDLKAGDIAVTGADHYADYREQLVAWDVCQAHLQAYCTSVGIPDTSKNLTAQLHEELRQRAHTVDTDYPTNDSLTIDANGVPSLNRIRKAPEPEGLATFKLALDEELVDRNLLDILGNVAVWTGYPRHFGPPAGGDPKMADAFERSIITIFGYGCNLGATQTARHTRGRWTAKMIATLHRQHVTVRKLEAANRDIINAYNRMVLPTFWGESSVAIADGTHIEMPDNRLLAEQHIRYGAYGGIIYQHISDRYIALFTRFIACGMWEAVYLLDGLINNTSDLQPDTIHADTQGQSTPVFALAYLLGIDLLPRIRHWKGLIFQRAQKDDHYQHIDPLFRGTVDWDLIEAHWESMMQVVISIKLGTLAPSTVLRKLSTYSRRNKLYQAFSALGYVIRTLFLLNYISNLPLRHEITAKTNKLESFHHFADWLSFGGDGVLQERDPDDQEKHLKYRELVANAVIYHNTVDMTKALRKLRQRGILLTPALLQSLSPYGTRHTKRFGDYVVDLSIPPAPIDEGSHLLEK